MIVFHLVLILLPHRSPVQGPAAAGRFLLVLQYDRAKRLRGVLRRNGGGVEIDRHRGSGHNIKSFSWHWWNNPILILSPTYYHHHLHRHHYYRILAIEIYWSLSLLVHAWFLLYTSPSSQDCKLGPFIIYQGCLEPTRMMALASKIQAL